MAITIVIITKNEALNIVDCILSARRLSDDIIVVDSGSSDGTVLLAQREKARVESIIWNGYGNARNKGAEIATNDWILALDADERITDGLATEIRSITLQEDSVYGFYRANFFGHVMIRFGENAHDRVFRLYHRKFNEWNRVPVHEKLVGSQKKPVTLQHNIIHLGIRNSRHYEEKKLQYASLCALKYFQDNKKHAGILRYVSPAFSFLKGYIFQLGFLDLRIGFTVAKVNARYTWAKYTQLQRLLRHTDAPPVAYGILPEFSKENQLLP